jgi:uncharacterized membrane protein (DUF2068 family)
LKNASAKGRTMHENKPLEKVYGHSLVIVRLIAIGKLFKAACLVVIGSFILHAIKLDKSVYDVLHDVVNAIRVDEHNEFIHWLLQKSLGVNGHILPWLSAGTLFYSFLYGLEGVGLLFDKGWAEWMVIVTTAGFIPLEVYEICHHPTVVRFVVFILNVLILIYIAMRVRWRHLAKLEARAKGATLITPDTTHRGIGP